MVFLVFIHMVKNSIGTNSDINVHSRIIKKKVEPDKAVLQQRVIPPRKDQQGEISDIPKH